MTEDRIMSAKNTIEEGAFEISLRPKTIDEYGWTKGRKGKP